MRNAKNKSRKVGMRNAKTHRNARPSLGKIWMQSNISGFGAATLNFRQCFGSATIIMRIRIQDVKKFVTDPDPGKNDPAKKD